MTLIKYHVTGDNFDHYLRLQLPEGKDPDQYGNEWVKRNLNGKYQVKRVKKIEL